MWTVELTESRTRQIQVDAETKEEADQKAQEMYNSGYVSFHHGPDLSVDLTMCSYQFLDKKE